MRIEANGWQFECRVDGPADAPWVVFSNSLMTGLNSWDDQVAALASRYRVLRYDQRGHGGSAVAPSGFTFAELSDDLLHLMNRLSVTEAVVAGVSMGGTTALTLAARAPTAVRAVIAADCQWLAPPGAAALWDERIRLVRDQGMEALVEPTIARWFTAGSLDGRSTALDRIRQGIRMTPVEGFAACAQVLQHYDVRAMIGSIRLPTLFIVGERDGQLPSVMREMHNAVPGSRLAMIADAGHLPNVEQPDAFNDIMITFLDDVMGHQH